MYIYIAVAVVIIILIVWAAVFYMSSSVTKFVLEGTVPTDAQYVNIDFWSDDMNGDVSKHVLRLRNPEDEVKPFVELNADAIVANVAVDSDEKVPATRYRFCWKMANKEYYECSDILKIKYNDVNNPLTDK